jgi:predicted kinase
MGKPTLVVVSGPARSGTRELAHALGERLPCPVICRDEIKEGMVHAYGAEFEPAAGDDLNQPARSVFFEVLGSMVTAGVTVVAEPPFRTGCGDRAWNR